jgi:hypothetical protein
MEKEEFLAALAENLKNATKKERDDVKAELAAHIEDHAADLTAAGWSAADAEAAAVAAMGDPGEIGAELNNEFSKLWGAVSRAASLTLIILVLLSFLPLCYACGNAVRSLALRIDPQGHVEQYFEGLDATPLNIRCDGADGDVVCFAMVAMTTDTLTGDDGREENWDIAKIGVCIYDKNPFRGVANDLNSVPKFLTDAPRYGGTVTSGGGMFDFWTKIKIYRVPVEHGQKTVTAAYDLYGTTFKAEILLPWGDAHAA